ncbi:zinc-binding dehydrogenase [Salana multivorans]
MLVQGAGGGVATACILLARAAGLRVLVTSRSPERAERARELGAHLTLGTGDRLPHQVDAVIETVGKATWSHSLRSLVPGGVIAVAGATTGPDADADLNRVFFKGLRVVGTTMGTRPGARAAGRFPARDGSAAARRSHGRARRRTRGALGSRERRGLREGRRRGLLSRATPAPEPGDSRE